MHVLAADELDKKLIQAAVQKPMHIIMIDNQLAHVTAMFGHWLHYYCQSSNVDSCGQ